jgi:predicted nucleotidyltransferase
VEAGQWCRFFHFISLHSNILNTIEKNVVFLFKQFQYMLDPEKNKVIIDYLQAYNPAKIGIFGSYARNESRPDSDLDILINLNTAISLFQLVRIERELSELLGVKVDLVSEGAIKNQKLRNYIEADLKIIFQS